jgi:hypothetical protein
MRAAHIQKILALIFLGLGGWSLLFPGVVESLVLRPEYYIGNNTSELAIGCFGAQAILVGIVIYTARFLPKTFLIFGLSASVPFFCFNYYFYFIRGMFTGWMLLDFIGNIGILICGVAGYRLSIREAKASKLSQSREP